MPGILLSVSSNHTPCDTLNDPKRRTSQTPAVFGCFEDALPTAQGGGNTSLWHMIL